MFSVWNSQLQTMELRDLFSVTLDQYRQVLSGLDWAWFRNENPEVYRIGEAAMREAFVAAETRGLEFQEAFRAEFLRHNPMGICPTFRSMKLASG